VDAQALHVPAGHPAFEGHFAGNPLLPGVALLAEVIEAVLRDPLLAAVLGPRPRIGVAKFLAPVRPGAQLSLQLTVRTGRVQFDIRQGERLAASGHLEAGSASAQHSASTLGRGPSAGPLPGPRRGPSSGPRRPAIPSGDRPTHTSDEGPH
jgi:hypothetical protein